MGKKKPSPRPWTVHLAAVYRRDRDERLARAYELVLPVITTTTGNPKEEEKIMKLLSHRTAIYARVASEQQAQHGTIQSQLAAVQEFAAANGLKIDPDLLFADDGVSGTTLARPQLDALRDKAAAGEVDQLLVLNSDRLTRKYTHQLMLVEEFKKLGVEITFVNRQITASPEDQLLL